MRSPLLIIPLAVIAGCAGPSPISSVQFEPIAMPWERVRRSAPPPGPAPAFQWQRIGTSVRGKSIDAAQFGEGALRIYIVGGMRGDEHEGPRAAAGLAQAMGRHADDVGVPPSQRSGSSAMSTLMVQQGTSGPTDAAST